MVLKKIELRNFRNYSRQEFTFNDKFNFIYGNNGLGKTNILEAVSFSAFGRSFLGSAEADCVRFGEEEFRIGSLFENDLGNTYEVGVTYNSSARAKTMTLGREKVSASSSEFFGKFPLVFLSPRSLSVTYGNPSERRKFFDILMSQASRLYLDHLRELAKVLKQKNALLRSYSLFRKYSLTELKDLLYSYNEKFVALSANIIHRRISFLNEFEKYLDRNYSMLVETDDGAHVNYESEALGESASAHDITEDYIEKKLGEAVYGKFEDEISRGMALAGPQRDDYCFRLSKRSQYSKETFGLKNFASQGEHKTFLVALKLSEYDYLKDRKATNPVLLLDDILSELDESRVSGIVSHLRDYGQIFLTTTDQMYSDNLREFYEDGEMSLFDIGKLKFELSGEEH